MFLARNAGSILTASRRGMLSSLPSLGSSTSILPGGSQSDSSMRFLSSKGGNKKKYDFRPRRRTPRSYRPVEAKAAKAKGPKEPFDISRSPRRIVTPADIKITDATEEDELEAFGPLAADAIRLARKHGDDLFTGGKPGSKYDVETQLRMMDYFTSAPGSTEDLVGERRALAFDMWDFEDRDHYATAVAEMIEEERIRSLEMAPTRRDRDEDLEPEIDSSETSIPTSQLAHGDWGDLLIRTDRVKKMWRGGRIESFRALVVGGNLNGCAGFGVGKAFEPEDAVEIACRMARHNIFFVDRYRGTGLTRDLVGRQNSCKVVLRCTDNGLRGNPVASEILKFMGVTNVVAKAHGSRNHYNVVRATFKALMTHESLEEIAMKRGVRLVNLEKAKRLQV